MGDHVVIGATDHPDPSLDTVVVLNGRHVVAREGDGVDLDGDGWANDGFFIDGFGEEDLVLTDALDLLVVVTLRGTTGAREGQALVRLRLDPGVGSVICAGVANSTGAGATGRAWIGGTPPPTTPRLRAADLPAGAACVFMLSRMPGHVLQPGGSQGQPCLADPSDCSSARARSAPPKEGSPPWTSRRTLLPGGGVAGRPGPGRPGSSRRGTGTVIPAPGDEQPGRAALL